MTTIQDAIYFPMISDMIQKVQNDFSNGDYQNMEECLNQYIRKNKYWPMVQTKRFFGNNGLVLLHNTYKRDDVDHFKALYDEIRSVVLDLNAPVGENIVVSLADKIPTRLTTTEYKNKMMESDVCEKGYEGTMVYVNFHKDQWYFGTSTCPSVDSSKYFHPTKTHGEMFNEVLISYFPDLLQTVEMTPKEKSKLLRDHFSSYLSTEHTYGFMLVHHENKHFMDYTAEFGENYKVLVHIFTRDKKTKGTTTAHDQSLSDIGLFYTEKIHCHEVGSTLENLNNYAVIVRTETNEVYKISRPEMIQKESQDLGNSNPWMNMMWVYMQGKPNYKVDDYIKEYLSDKKDSLTVLSKNGQVLAPIYIIHTIMCTMRDTLHSLYFSTTYYNKHTQRYTINMELDKSLSPILRFHLAQLRNIQVTTHTHAPINQRSVYHYLCFHQTMKNMRLLVNHFASVASASGGYMTRAMECMILLNNLLKG